MPHLSLDRRKICFRRLQLYDMIKLQRGQTRTKWGILDTIRGSGITQQSQHLRLPEVIAYLQNIEQV
jgi:hypothetical protein